MRWPGFVGRVLVVAIACCAAWEAALDTAANAGAHPARAAANDGPALLRYLRAEYRYERRLKALLPVERTALNRLVGSVTRECPGALGKAPKMHGASEIEQELSRSELAQEVQLAPIFASFVPQHAVLTPRLRALVSLRRTSGSLGRLVRAQTILVRGELSFMTPRLCADARAWAASHYRKVHRATRKLLKAFDALLIKVLRAGGALPVLTEAVTHEDRQARRLARHLEALTNEVDNRLSKITDKAAGRLASALGLDH